MKGPADPAESPGVEGRVGLPHRTGYSHTQKQDPGQTGKDKCWLRTPKAKLSEQREGQRSGIRNKDRRQRIDEGEREGNKGNGAGIFVSENRDLAHKKIAVCNGTRGNAVLG